MTKTGDEYRFKGAGGCITVDYDVIYDESPTDYLDNTPCEECVKRTFPEIECEYNDETGECVDCTVVSYPETNRGYAGEASTAPHGQIRDFEHVLCSRMVIYRNARIDGSSISYDERAVFRSRKRSSLPFFTVDPEGKLECIRAPMCNAGNRRTCCSCTNSNGSTNNFSVVGPYRGCEERIDGGTCAQLMASQNGLTPVSLGAACFNCDEKGRTPVPPLKHMVTPCNFFSPYTNFKNEVIDPEYGERRYIFGYDRIDDGWWFFDTSEYTAFEQQITEDDPIGTKPHTIVMHFEMRARPISCCSAHCPDAPDSGSSVGCYYIHQCNPPECHNKINSKCNSCNKISQFYKTPEERQRRVKIVAAAGFTMECGSFDFNALCDKVWDEKIDE